MIALLVATTAITMPPVCPVTTDRFDLLEVNHVVNEAGNPRMDQLLYWDWDRHDRKFNCQGWRLMSSCRDLSDPQKARQHDQHVTWFLGKLPAEQQAYWRRRLTYKGEFVGGPWLPMQNSLTGDWVVHVFDDCHERRIIARMFRETWTFNDPERDDRHRFPERSRRGLSKPEVRQ